MLCKTCEQQMRPVVNLPLSTAEDLKYFNAECVVVPNERMGNLPSEICVSCFPRWIELHELGMSYCRIWANVVEAVAKDDFLLAAKNRSALKSASLAINRLLDEILD